MNNEQLYKTHCKPKLADLLAALKLDLTVSSAQGNYLISDDGRKILDLVSGFGAAALGHNHPDVVATAVSALRENSPIFVQGTIRSASARLAARLNELLPTDSARYCVNFSNSGTESVEAAIKHAYKVQFEKVLREYERLSRLLNDFYYRVDRMSEPPELPGKNDDLIDFRDDLDEYNLAQLESFQNNPVMIGFKGGYHGKTVASLKVTFNKSFRESFEGLSAIRPVFVDPERPERISEVVNENVCTFYYPTLEDGKVKLNPVKLTKVIGLIFETVMGEGGIKPLPDATLEYLASHHGDNGIAYIVDEIQTGCGRTGHIYSYADTPLVTISPEYITLSKALGGGVAKIGATLIRDDVYDHDFGILHTSTFGEDDLSSEIALSTLDVLTANGEAVLARARESGAILLKGLQELRRAYPEIIRDVRGKGLMIGLELTSLESSSPFFRAAGKQGVLSLLIASYLLEHHNVRVLAPLTTMLKGNPGKSRLSVLRIQPPLTIEPWEAHRLISALKEVCEIVRASNEFCLVGHLIGSPPTAAERKRCRSFPARWPLNETPRHIDARAGFVLHPVSVDKLVEYYFPSFEGYAWNRAMLETWWNRISRFLEPVHVRNEYVSSNEFTVELSLVFVPYLPQYINANREDPRLAKEMRDKVQDAVTVARELGDDNIPVSVVGLGAYTSIVTQNGQTINDYEIPITTGNAYTVGLTMQGILKAAQHQGLDLAEAKVAIIGAAGNIGLVLGQILLPRVEHLALVGSQRPGSEYRLRYARQQCLKELLSVIREERVRSVDFDHTSIKGHGYRIYQCVERASSGALLAVQAAVAGDEPTTALAKSLDRILSDEYPHLLPPVATSTQALNEYDIVVVATSSDDDELIHPGNLKPDAIICCTSVPSNLSALFGSHDKQLAFDGGLAKLPERSEITFVGMPEGGLAYGCLAETLVLAFDGHNHSYSKGVLEPRHVYEIMRKADVHGFSLGALRLDDELLALGRPHAAQDTAKEAYNV